ncbi:MAG: indole-3-glycerol phosphate synthase TrpC [Planctomycetota bacterium]|nr:indole-3-glycerol phosphate synthase TrpC [Planctomycetota bacterium]
MSVLDQIMASKRVEVDALKREPGLASLRARSAEASPTRDFARALRTGDRPRVIAEFKRRSPSRDAIRPGADPAEIAAMYASAGAAALSVLTDDPFFGGSLDDLRAARAACDLPVLRKDFTIDAIQLFEARAAGADAVLLIVSSLDDTALSDLYATARELGLAALVEVHDEHELERAQAMGAELIGINNRDLQTQTTDLETTERLVAGIGEPLPFVAESGIRSSGDVERMQRAGAVAVLIGEVFMRADDIASKVRELFPPV